MAKMNKVSFEYCAMKYLNNWVKTDSIFHEIFKKKGEYFTKFSKKKGSRDIVSALHSYKIHRNFGELNDKKCLDIFKHVIHYSSRFEAKIPTTGIIVEELAEKFKEKYGSKNLSAASKLLWLRNKSPVVIYDRNVQHALKNLGYKETTKYSVFLDNWNKEFDKHKADIKKATSQLHKVKNFTLMHDKSVDDFNKVVTSGWFQERVFDIFLWETGEADTLE
jgi:hypothetical protein